MVPYSADGDPSGAGAAETRLEVRPLLIDGFVKAWTTGEMHTVTEHTFVVQQARRVNDDLPGQKKVQWIWQRGPWLMVDRTHGSAREIRLPDYEANVSDVVWFRDLAAYCGVKSSGRELVAVIYRLNVSKPVLARRLGVWSPGKSPNPACAPAGWQRQPLSVTFQQSGGSAASYDIFGNFAVLSKAAPR